MRRALSNSLPAVLACLLAIGVLASSGISQLVFDYRAVFSPSPGFGFNFGNRLETLDVNRDGFEDLIVTEDTAKIGTVFGAGRCWILFGPTFSSSVSMAPGQPSAGEQMGLEYVSVGDVDGDGEYDVLLGSPHYVSQGQTVGRAHLFFGPEFTNERVFYDPTPEAVLIWGFGFSVLLADVDGDGQDDVVVGAPDTHQVDGPLPYVGEVWIWYAKDLDTAVRLPNQHPTTEARFGFDLAAARLDGGPALNLLVGATWELAVPYSGGTIHRLKSEELTLVHTIHGPPGFGVIMAEFGQVPFIGDMNEDGELDLVVTAPATTLHMPAGNSGVVTILAGPDFESAIHTFQSPAPDSYRFGDSVAVSDMDRDGHLDVIIDDWDGTSSSAETRVRVFFGPDYTSVQSIGDEFIADGVVVPNAMGAAAIAVGDFDGDGFDEVVASAFGAVGGVYVFDQRTLRTETSAMSIAAGGTVELTLDMSPQQVGYRYLTVLSLAPPGDGLILGHGAYVPFTPDALTLLGLALMPTHVLERFSGRLDAQGDAHPVLHWPAGAGSAAIGQTLRIAAVTIDPHSQLRAGSSLVEIEILP